MSEESPGAYLLVIEDSDEDFEALKRVIERNCNISVPIVRCADGDEGMDYLRCTGTYENRDPHQLPGLILLDLNLPGTDGRELLTEIKKDSYLKSIPAVVLTTSSNPKDVECCYQYGANSYLIKPMNISQMKTSICVLMNYWFSAVVLPSYPVFE